jgi:hypothetical protein
MNKRQMKKRSKPRSFRVGDRVYTAKEIMKVNKAHIGYMNIRLLYPNIKNPKITRPRMRSLINYIYKNRIKYTKRFRFKPRFHEYLDDKAICFYGISSKED